jgi:hypothetical protein
LLVASSLRRLEKYFISKIIASDMSPLDALIIFILIIGSWYAVSHVVAHRFNRSVVKGCGCAVERWIGGPNSLFISVLCNNDKIEMFINRLPWDNPVNLLAAFVAGRRPYVAARFMLPIDIGAADASRSGRGRKIGDYYVVNRSTPKDVLEKILSYAAERGIWRITVSGRSVQLIMPGTDCGKALSAALGFVKLFSSNG